MAMASAGCAATSSVQWTQPVVAAHPPACGSVLVMEPLWRATAPGNVGRDVRGVTAMLSVRILGIVREEIRAAETIDDPLGQPGPALPAYPRTLDDGSTVPVQELNAARAAYKRGAACLLVPTVLDWRQMRTDDPVGAFLVGHNRIAVDLRLMQLQPPLMLRRVVFRNHARLTLNQPVDRLLNGAFRTAVLRLVTGAP
jgi:hypothetical protein